MSIVKLTVRPVDEENHRDISVVSMDNEVIGYICPNYDRNHGVKPYSAVYCSGKTIGDFSTHGEAVVITFKYHIDFQNFLNTRKGLFDFLDLVEGLSGDTSQTASVY